MPAEVCAQEAARRLAINADLRSTLLGARLVVESPPNPQILNRPQLAAGSPRAYGRICAEVLSDWHLYRDRVS